MNVMDGIATALVAYGVASLALGVLYVLLGWLFGDGDGY